METRQNGTRMGTSLDEAPAHKRLRSEVCGSPSGSVSSLSSPQTPVGGGSFVRVKSMSRPSSLSSIPSPPSAQLAAQRSPTIAGNVSTGQHPLDLVERWAGAMARAMMKHWPKEEEPQVLAVCRKVARRIPGAASAASGQVRVLIAAFQDPKNEKLRGEVIGEIIDIDRLVRMNEMELTNPELREKREREFLERNKSKDWTELKKAMSGGSSDMFRCPRCEKRDTMWEQRQTRSADEPMTILISCNNCGFYWRKRG